MKILFRGAESIIYVKNNILHKERLCKEYRLNELDSKIIKQRTKKEIKIIKLLNSLNISCPKYLFSKDNIIMMEYIDGKTIKEFITENIFYEVGKLVFLLHKNNIVHGDLTTSNFIYRDKLYIIDFGLSFISLKNEDKAVDLFVFEKSIRCAHDEKYIDEFYEGYKSSGDTKEIMERLEKVRKRGRKHEIEY